MKVLYATDLHGQIPKFECIKQILDDHRILILGADLLPKGITASTQKINRFIFNYLSNFFQHFYDIPIILDFGNDDWMMYYDSFKRVVSAFDNVYISNMTCHEINGYKFCGMNYVPDYPFGNKDWCRRDGDRILCPVQDDPPYTSINGSIEDIGDLEKFLLDVPSLLEELNYLPKPTSNAVYLIHCPPYGSGLDYCFSGAVGSKDVRKWIEKEQPWLTLHGHIHESFELTKIDITKIGNTICINPGQKGGGGRTGRMFVWCEFDLNNVEATFKRKEMRE